MTTNPIDRIFSNHCMFTGLASETEINGLVRDEDNKFFNSGNAKSKKVNNGKRSSPKTN